MRTVYSSRSAGLAAAPVTTTYGMEGTTISVGSSYRTLTTSSIQGLSTCATNIHGEVVAGGNAYATMGACKTGARKTPVHHGDIEFESDCGCDWHFDDENDRIYCPICGCWLSYLDIGEHVECHCKDESGYCWCPIGDGWEVWLFMVALAGAYAVYKGEGRKVRG